MTAPAQCKGTKVDGSRCGATLGLAANGLCLHHDPDRAERALEVVRAGGAASGLRRRADREGRREQLPRGMPRRRPRTLDDALRWASWATYAVACGDIDVRRAREVAGLVKEFRSTLERRDMAREVADLRAELERLKKLRSA
jgi:hypothetical protein